MPVIKALRREFQSELVRASIMKLNIDGGDARYTAALLAPYTDAPRPAATLCCRPTCLPTLSGAPIAMASTSTSIATATGGTRLSLDAFEAAIKVNPPAEPSAHLGACDPGRSRRRGAVRRAWCDCAVFRAMDGARSTMARRTRARFGAARSEALYSMNSILRHGGLASFGTDWPAAGYYSTFRPLDAIEVATTRRELDRPHGAATTAHR